MSRITDDVRIVALLPCIEAAPGQNGLWNISDIFKFVEASSLPYIMPSMDVYVQLSKASSDHPKLSFQMFSPGGQLIQKGSMTVNDWPESDIADYSFDLKDVVFREVGAYVIRLQSEGGVTAETRVTLLLNRPGMDSR